MKYLVLVLVFVFALEGCSENINSQGKRALVPTINTNLKTGLKTDGGWQEVYIIEEQGNMAKVKWVESGTIAWIHTDKNFKRID